MAADGTKAEGDSGWLVGGEWLRFPGDPYGSAWNVINCHCQTHSQVVTNSPAMQALRERNRKRRQEWLQNNAEHNKDEKNWRRGENGVENKHPYARTKTEQIGIEKIEPLNFSSGQQVNAYFHGNSSYVQWSNGLSDGQKDSIFGYSGRDYKYINEYLRFGNAPNNLSMTERDINNLDSTIGRFVLEEPIRVYRGVQSKAFDEVLEKYKVSSIDELIGKQYNDKGYMSTTAYEGNPIATAKDVCMIIDIPKGRGVGAYINDFSMYDDAEYQFLINRDSTFVIDSVQTDENTRLTTVRMRLKNWNE